jgi:putative transposase
MLRKPRVTVFGVPEHLIQRGNNRKFIFVSDGDMKAYVIWLKITQSNSTLLFMLGY